MAQISDVMRASAVFDAARQELAWAYSGDFADVPEPVKGAVHTIAEVLTEAQMRWVTSTGEEKSTVMAVDKKNGMAAVAMGHEEKEVDTQSIRDAESKIKDWLRCLEEVAYNMRVVARKKLVPDYSNSRMNDKLSARWLPCLPRTSRAARIIAPTINTVARELEKLEEEYHEEFGHCTTGLPLAAATCTEEQPACSSAAGGQEGRLTSVVTGDVLVERDDDATQRIIDIIIKDNIAIIDSVSYEYPIDYPIDTVTPELENLENQHHKEFGHCTTGLPLAAATCTEEQPACISAAGGQEGRESSVVTGDVLVVERDDDANKQKIINIINRHYNKGPATVLQIGGPTCVGKTTLVQSVFDNAGSIGAGYKVWVDMRKGWDIKEIHESIIKELGQHENFIRENVQGEVDCDRYIKRMLVVMKTRLLLVLDNLEQEHRSMLDKLFEFLGYISGEFVITILITRSNGLPWYIPLLAVKHYVHVLRCRLHPYSDDMCRETIKRTTGIDLEATTAAVAVPDKVGREIASDCSGIPLAAKPLGRFLEYVEDPQEWERLRRDVSNIGELLSSRDWHQKRSGLPIPSASTRSTLFKRFRHTVHLSAESWFSLAYCAFLIPEGKGKGHGVATCDLLNQWCSLRIIPTREHGAECIRRLLDHSLILGEEPVRSYNPGSASVKATTLLTMEDLMHDLARYLLGDRLIVVSASSPVNNKISTAYLALVINFDAKQLDISSILPAGILALRFEGCGEMELSDGAFASFGKYLRLLDLSGYSMNKMLPDFIHHLKQLRYLKAPGIQDQKCPRSITGLHELSYLILQDSSKLKDLTKAFQMLGNNLLHLDLSRCYQLKALPDSFGRLWRLEHLNLSGSGIQEFPESFAWLRLRHLDMSGCSGLKKLPISFGMLTSLWHLDMSGCSGLEDLMPTTLQNLTELRHLDLSGCSKLTRLPRAPEPNELRHLDLSGCSSIIRFDHSYAKLEKLVYLNLSGCSVRQIPWTGGDGQRTRQLEHLDLSDCSNLRSIPDELHLPKLKYLDLSGCFQIKEARPSEISNFVDAIIRISGGRASGPHDASLRSQGTNGTTN